MKFHFYLHNILLFALYKTNKKYINNINLKIIHIININININNVSYYSTTSIAQNNRCYV